MRAFTRSVVSGFAFSLGAALFRKLAPKLGLDDKSGKDAEKAGASASTDDRGTDSRDRGGEGYSSRAPLSPLE